MLVLGLGNPILRDDGVGWRVVEEVRRQWTERHPLERIFDVEFDCISLGGLTLMERLVGYERAVLVDAIQTRDGAPGTVYRLTLEDLPTLPAEVIIYAIEAANIWDFGETLSPEVDGSVMVAASAVVEELEEEEVWSHPNCCAGTRSSAAWPTRSWPALP
jgi:hydrogenase maturation protease